VIGKTQFDKYKTLTMMTGTQALPFKIIGASRLNY